MGHAESAKFVDRHGSSTLWVPGRHFHAFGGQSPNLSVMAAVLAALPLLDELREVANMAEPVPG